MSNLTDALIAAKLMGNGGGGGGGGLPSVTSADDGKALVVEDGAWAINYPSPIAVVWLMYDEVEKVSYIDVPYDTLKNIKNPIAVYSPPYKVGDDPYFKGNLTVCSGGFAYYIARGGTIFTLKSNDARMEGIETLGIDFLYQNGAWTSSMSYSEINQFIDGATEENVPELAVYISIAGTSSDFDDSYVCALFPKNKFGPGGAINGYTFDIIDPGHYEFDKGKNNFNGTITKVKANVWADNSADVRGTKWTITPTVTTIK